MCDITVIDQWQDVSSSQPKVQTRSVCYGNATAMQRKHLHAIVHSALQSLAVISPSSLTSVCPAFSHKSENSQRLWTSCHSPVYSPKEKFKTKIWSLVFSTVQLMSSLSIECIRMSCHLTILIDSNVSPVLYFVLILPWVDHLLGFWLVLYTLSIYSQRNVL